MPHRDLDGTLPLSYFFQLRTFLPPRAEVTCHLAAASLPRLGFDGSAGLGRGAIRKM